MRRIIETTLVTAAVAVLLTGCTINPATGQRQLTLMSEREEIQIGLESDAAIVDSMGLYDDPGMQAYLQRLGENLAAVSERPHLNWSFKVVDDPIVNAFALPGGYIYITRGIMAHVNSEAELASVVGHEIGHVTARHGVNQMSKATLAQLGLTVGMAVSEDLRQYGGLAQQGLGLMFLKFSRDDERQADDLGLRYIDGAGFDPRPMPEVYDMLARVSSVGGGQTLPSWFSSHPAPENRAARIEAGIQSMGRDFSGRPTHRDEYLARLDGLVFGEDPREGYFDGGRFLHPEMRFRIDFPDSWKNLNTRSAVQGLHPEQDAAILLTLTGAGNPREGLDGFFTEGMARGPGWRNSVNGFPCASQEFTAASDGQNVRGLVAFIAYDDSVYRLLGYSSESSWPQRVGAIQGAIESFNRLTDRAALDVEAARLKIVTPPRRMSLDEFARKYRSTASPATLALINDLPEGGRVEAGRPYKVVVGGQ